MTHKSLIKSDLASVIQRQIDCGAYQSEQFVYSPYMSAYWSGHLIEELLEFVNEYSADEAADVIIFLQNLTAYLYPKETLVLDLSNCRYSPPLPILLRNIRTNIPNRKSWKNYPPIPFKEWENQVVEPIMGFLLDFVPGENIKTAYESKIVYNTTRADWNR